MLRQIFFLSFCFYNYILVHSIKYGCVCLSEVSNAEFKQWNIHLQSSIYLSVTIIPVCEVEQWMYKSIYLQCSNDGIITQCLTFKKPANISSCSSCSHFGLSSSQHSLQTYWMESGRSDRHSYWSALMFWQVAWTQCSHFAHCIILESKSLSE